MSALRGQVTSCDEAATVLDYYRLLWPFIRRLDSERAHGLAIVALRNGLVPVPAIAPDPILATRVWGLDFANPVGLAAGFDKNAEVVDRLLEQGFGFVEVGSVTPRPQPGNPKPRMFRLIAKLKLDLQYPNPTSEESRAQIMRDIEEILRDAEKRAALLFDIRPQAPVVAQPFPRFREANAAANYNAPAPDGSRPGTFQFPRRIEWMTRFGLRSVVYHETVPGHHFHIALQVENRELPRFRQVGALGGNSAVTEGWGLYAERLAAESGWYGDDLEGQLGQLDYELMRARRLVIDTGLHAKRWTRQQAIDYGIEASEVERYTVFPGQACSYMIGELKILELRDKAQKTLGNRFSLREFHNVVLRAGIVPLQVLESQVDSYVVAKNNVAALRL